MGQVSNRLKVGGAVLIVTAVGVSTFAVAQGGSGGEPGGDPKVTPPTDNQVRIYREFCPDGPCLFVPGEGAADFASSNPDASLAEGVASAAAKPADCPDAAKAYAGAGYDVAGFIGGCPTGNQLSGIREADPQQLKDQQRALEMLP